MINSCGDHMFRLFILLPLIALGSPTDSLTTYRTNLLYFLDSVEPLKNSSPYDFKNISNITLSHLSPIKHLLNYFELYAIVQTDAAISKSRSIFIDSINDEIDAISTSIKYLNSNDLKIYNRLSQLLSKEQKYLKSLVTKL